MRMSWRQETQERKPKRRAAAAIVRSRTISSEMPALATAYQAMISRSLASMTNSTHHLAIRSRLEHGAA